MDASGFPARLDGKLGLVGDVDPHVAERPVRNRARYAPDDLLAVSDLVAGLGALDVEHPQPPVDLSAMAETGDRLLPRVAALRKRDVRLVETCLRGEDRVVELLAPGGRGGFDPDALDLVRGQSRGHVDVQEL